MAEKFGVGTLDIPMLVVHKDGPYIPYGSYFPAQLGLYMEGVYAINVGICTSFPEPTRIQQLLGYGEGDDRFESQWAHAHVEEGVICFAEGDFIFENFNVPSDVLVHEYCHILRGVSDQIDGHDVKWKQYMRRYGLHGIPECQYVCIR